MDRALSIGDLARQSGTNPPTIRYYEQIGLIRRADRRDGGHRTYGQTDLKRLTFIRRCRDFGFPIEQVRSLVGLIEDDSRSCIEVRDLASAHLADVRVKLDELKALEASLRYDDPMSSAIEAARKAVHVTGAAHEAVNVKPARIIRRSDT